jgi:hypothetical protein
MDEAAIRAWFDDYNDGFGAAGRGDTDDLAPLLEHYAIPLLITTPDAVISLPTLEHIRGVIGQMVDGMRAVDYQRTDVVEAQTTALNATSVLLTTVLSRVGTDGRELQRLDVTYLVVDEGAGPRIAVMAVG